MTVTEDQWEATCRELEEENDALRTRVAAQERLIEAVRPFARMAHPWPGTRLVVYTRDEQETGEHDRDKELILRHEMYVRMWDAWDAYNALCAAPAASIPDSGANMQESGTSIEDSGTPAAPEEQP